MAYPAILNQKDKKLAMDFVAHALRDTKYSGQQFDIKLFKFEVDEAGDTDYIIKVDFPGHSKKLIIKAYAHDVDSQTISDAKSAMNYFHNSDIELAKAPIAIGQYKQEKYCVMEMAEGRELEDITKDFAMNIVGNREIYDIYKNVGKALADIHMAGAKQTSYKDFQSIKTNLVHGDFHGGNIFVDDQAGEIKVNVIDWENRSYSQESSRLLDDFNKLSRAMLTHYLLSQDEELTADNVMLVMQGFLSGYASNIKADSSYEFIQNDMIESIEFLCEYNKARSQGNAHSFIKDVIENNKYTNCLDNVDIDNLNFYLSDKNPYGDDFLDAMFGDSYAKTTEHESYRALLDATLTTDFAYLDAGLETDKLLWTGILQSAKNHVDANEC